MSEKCQSCSCTRWQLILSFGNTLPPRSALTRSTMAQKQPVGKLPIPSLTTPMPWSKTSRQKKTNEEKQTKKKEIDRGQNKRRINIRAAFQRWRKLRYLKERRRASHISHFKYPASMSMWAPQGLNVGYMWTQWAWA